MKSISLIFFSFLLIACSSNKTVFVSNKLNRPITLSVDSTYISTQDIVFKDSLEGKKIEKSLIIHFGKGKWSKSEKEELIRTFHSTEVILEGGLEEPTFRPNIQVNHIRLFVEELLVRIK